MALITTSEAIAHCHLESDYPVEQLQPYIDAAQSYAVAYLNRAVYADQDALDAAMDGVAAGIGQAYDAYIAALDAAEAIDNPAQKQATIDLAQAVYDAAQLNARRVMNGIVINGAIHAAMLLIFGNLFANRETDVVGASVASLPMSAKALLSQHRCVQMP